MRILLIFPPWGEPIQPYSSIPCLYAYLKAHGLEVHQVDLNIMAYYYFLNKSRLSRSLSKINYELAKLQCRTKVSNHFLDMSYKFQISSLIGSYIIENIDEAIQNLKDNESFYDFDNYMQANYIIQKALELLSNEFYPTEISPYLFSIINSLERIEEIETAISNDKENPFIEFYEKRIIKDILDSRPALIGVSITYSNQFIPALTLSKLIKEISPSTHITVGGAYVTKLAEEIKKTPQIFNIIDSAVIYEGEKPLLRLAKVIENGKSLEGVPNLIFINNDQVHATHTEPALPLSRLPAPLYEGFPLNLYFSPDPVLLIMDSKGCYWNRCTFCDIPKNSTQRFQLKDVQTVIKEVVFYGETYGIKNFVFSSDSLLPKFLQQFSDEVIRKGLNIRWQGELRFDKALTEGLLEKMAKAGCRNLIFGFEAGSQRVLDLMDKGTQLPATERILKTCAELGIGVNLQSFIGFPTETREEAKDTIRFFLDNRDILGSVSFGYFQLLRITDIFEKAEAYGVEPIIDLNKKFHLAYPYKVKHGLTQDEIIDLYSELNGEIEPSFYVDAESFATNGVTAHSLLYFANDYKNTMNYFKKESSDTNRIIFSPKDQPIFNGDRLILQETHLDMNGIAQFVEEKNTKGSVKVLDKKQNILVFNKNTHEIIQFRNSSIFWDLIHRLNGDSTLEQIYQEICEANSIYAEDDLFKEEFTRFIELLFEEQLIKIHREKKDRRGHPLKVPCQEKKLTL